MEIFRGYRALGRTLKSPVVSIGNFDGVHRGHQVLLKTAQEKASARQGECVVYTFRPHPQVALRPGAALSLLTTYDERLELFRDLGVQCVIEEPFSREFSTIEPQVFFNEVLVRQLGAEAIVVGYDFAFGKERHGHLDSLQRFCQSVGIELTVVPPQRHQGEVVSSSRIRQYLLAGDVGAAESLMGRPFQYCGAVVRGAGRGRQLGFPTANLKLAEKLTLPFGVYATWARVGSRRFASVTNVGVRPTFQAEQGLDSGGSVEARELPALVETHLLDFSENLYGEEIEVHFIKRLRSEQKFQSFDALKEQIQKDIVAARKLAPKIGGFSGPGSS